jgi:methylmalonyl-CoA mutase C-terminal domain/subunit
VKTNKKIRVLLVKHWMECHDRGVKSIAMMLRDAGFEVIYTAYMNIGEIVSIAVQESVDVIGMSFSTQAYDIHVPELLKLMKEEKIEDVKLIVGGVIPNEDAKVLKEQGVMEVFAAGANTNHLIRLLNTEQQ